eukprot:jgi/Orpsp1_1/1177725/evm.model.c7180000062600.1
MLNYLYQLDKRDKNIILSEIFQIIYDDKKYENRYYKNKKIAILKNKYKIGELKLPIDNYYINNLVNYEEIKNKISHFLIYNKMDELKIYIEKNNIIIYPENDFDILIDSIKSNKSNEIIELIIKYYCNLNYHINERIIDIIFSNDDREENKSPLSSAIVSNRYNIADLLLKSGADINYRIEGKDIITKLYNEKLLNNNNLNYILRNGFKITNELITETIGNFNNNFLKIIFDYYVFNNEFILQLLSLYKNQKKISNEKLKSMISQENDKIPRQFKNIYYHELYKNKSISNNKKNKKVNQNSILDNYEKSGLLIEAIYNHKEKKLYKYKFKKFLITEIFNHPKFHVKYFILDYLVYENCFYNEMPEFNFYIFSNLMKHKTFNFNDIKFNHLLEFWYCYSSILKKKNLEYLIISKSFDHDSFNMKKIDFKNTLSLFEEYFCRNNDNISIFDFFVKKVLNHIKFDWKYIKIDDYLINYLSYYDDKLRNNSIEFVEYVIKNLLPRENIPRLNFFEILLYASKRNCIPIMKLLLEKLLNVSSIDTLNDTTLNTLDYSHLKKKDIHNLILIINIIIKIGHFNLLKYSLKSSPLKNKIDLNKKDENDDYPIIVACKSTNNNPNNIKIFEYLLEKKCCCNIRDIYGDSLLLNALKSGNYLVLHSLFKLKDPSIFKLDIDIDLKYYSPLMKAVYYNNLEQVKVIVEKWKENDENCYWEYHCILLLKELKEIIEKFSSTTPMYSIDPNSKKQILNTIDILKRYDLLNNYISELEKSVNEQNVKDVKYLVDIILESKLYLNPYYLCCSEEQTINRNNTFDKINDFSINYFNPLILAYLLNYQEIFNYLKNSFINNNMEYDYYNYNILYYAILKDDEETIKEYIEKRNIYNSNNKFVNYPNLNIIRPNHSVLNICIALKCKTLTEIINKNKQLCFIHNCNNYNYNDKKILSPYNYLFKLNYYNVEEMINITKTLLLNKINISLDDFKIINSKYIKEKQDENALIKVIIENSTPSFIDEIIMKCIDNDNDELFKLILDQNVTYAFHNMNLIMNAIINKNKLNMLKLIIPRYIDLSKEKRESMNYLLWSIEAGNEAISIYLIENNIDFQFINKKLLNKIIKNKEFNLLKLLLIKEKEIYKNEGNINTPLMNAIRKGFNRIIKLLKDHDNDINVQDYEFKIPIIEAIKNKNYSLNIKKMIIRTLIENYNSSILDLLLQYIQNINNNENDKNEKYNTVIKFLCYVCQFKNSEEMIKDIIRYENEKMINSVNTNNTNNKLIDEKDENGLPPLIHAIKANNISIIKYLIDLGANINEKYKNGETVLTYAIKYSNKAIVEYLFNHSLIIQNDDDYYSFYQYYGNSYGSNINLLLAIVNQKFDIAKLLVNKGIYINIVEYLNISEFNVLNYVPQSSLYYAIIYGNLSFLKYMVKYGKTSRKEIEDLPDIIKMAVQTRKYDILFYLINHGAKATGLMEAIKNKNIYIVNYLLNHQATISKESEPLKVAIENGDINMIHYLIWHRSVIHGIQYSWELEKINLSKNKEDIYYKIKEILINLKKYHFISV